MTIGHREEVAVLEPTQVWHCNPGILILLVGVRWRLPCLGRKRELGHTIRVHLLWIRTVVTMLELNCLALWHGMAYLLRWQTLLGLLLRVPGDLGQLGGLLYWGTVEV